MVMKSKTKIGNRLETFAISVFGNRTRFANALGRKKQQLDSYINGGTLPGATVLQDLAKRGLNIDWLLTGEGEMLNAAGAKLLGLDSKKILRVSRRIQNPAKSFAALTRITTAPEPDEVWEAMEIVPIGEYQLYIVTKNNKRILYVKTNG